MRSFPLTENHGVGSSILPLGTTFITINIGIMDDKLIRSG